jgi:hypothetical protein
LDIYVLIDFFLFGKASPYFLPINLQRKSDADKSRDDELDDIASGSEVDVAIGAQGEEKERQG